MRTASRNKSAVNNRRCMRWYNKSDAEFDNPEARPEEIPEIVRAVNEDRPLYPRTHLLGQ